MASSSAIQLADLALLWSNATGDADLTMIDSDLASDRSLATAVLLSLFTDRRAHDDDVPPSGDSRDRRGWWADQFAVVGGDLIGSRLWLLDRSTLTNENALKAKQYALEALQWMLDDAVVASIDVTVTNTSNGRLIVVAVQRPSGDRTTFSFDPAWSHLVEDI
jgi:phage gp46-like protein